MKSNDAVAMNRAAEPEGMLLVGKPSGMTSHDVVQIIRHRLSIRRIGHTGTLDPMAEGLLILLVGGATRHQQAFQSHDKRYEATIRLGVQTDTGDADGRALRTAAVPAFSQQQVASVFSALEGSMEQTPPAFSAVKVHGRPAYWWARRQQAVPLSARVIRIFSLSLIDCTQNSLTVAVECSSGTYIRSLAELISERLGTVGHVKRLTRMRIGQWSLDQALPLLWYQQAGTDALLQQLKPVESFIPCAQPLS